METIMTILNLTQHDATPTQSAAGVIEPSPETKVIIKRLLNVGALPTVEDLVERAEGLAAIALHHHTMTEGTRFLIGGAGPLMRVLRRALKSRITDVQCLEAFSERVVVETTLPDGTVRKTADFVHAGWWPDVD